MHLGRFHYVIDKLANHFRDAGLPAKLEQCAAALDQYAQTRAAAQIDAFRSALDALIASAQVADIDLSQPYALQVIHELSLADILDPGLDKQVHALVEQRTFDHAGLATDLRALGVEVNKKAAHVAAIDKGFTQLGVEYECVDKEEAEVGLHLPRSVVGETLTELTSEFGKIARLARAINELTGSDSYDPRVRTISSSWWQVFLDLDAAQVVVWVVAIEKIVSLFKTNLEVKDLQQRLAERKMPPAITEAIEKEIESRISTSLEQLASNLRQEFGKMSDQQRANEVENQLRQGLRHLAMRINQGAQVEINIAVPEDPSDPTPESESEQVDQAVLDAITSRRARLAEMRVLRQRAIAASVETLRIDTTTPLLLEHEQDEKTDRVDGTAQG